MFAGAEASVGTQDSTQAADDSAFRSKLGAAVKDWKVKQRVKPDISASKETVNQAESSVPPGQGEGSGSQSWVLKPFRVALPPPLQSLRCGLPSPKYPSDHISLIADFSMLQQQPDSGKT